MSVQTTQQMQLWQGRFGAEYTDRSQFTLDQLEQFYVEEYGVGRRALNHQFLDGLELNRVLEVGCNVGNQLRSLQEYGVEHLYGVELQWYAVEKSKQLTRQINIIQGSAFDIPYKDRYFDLVYTFGVLIHIAPEHLERAMSEIYRVSGKYIWGLEYYSDQMEEVDYRGNQTALWKTDYAAHYMRTFPDLKLVKQVKLPYLRNTNVDHMFLLEKS